MSNFALNNSLFLWINASVAPPQWLLTVSTFIAHDLLGVYIGLITALLFKSPTKYKKAYLNSLLLVLVSLAISALIDHFYYHPRPFVIHLGHLLVPHAATNSFPSHHMLTISTLALSLYVQGCKNLGKIGLIIAASVGWSRVYLGMHFPLDIIGAFLIAVLIVLGFVSIRKVMSYVKWGRLVTSH